MDRDIMKKIGFEKEVSESDRGICPFCHKKVRKLRDELSLKEFKISGLCQYCQDEMSLK